MISVDSVVTAGHIVVAVTRVQQCQAWLPAHTKTGILWEDSLATILTNDTCFFKAAL